MRIRKLAEVIFQCNFKSSYSVRVQTRCWKAMTFRGSPKLKTCLVYLGKIRHHHLGLCNKYPQSPYCRVQYLRKKSWLARPRNFRYTFPTPQAPLWTKTLNRKRKQTNYKQSGTRFEFQTERKKQGESKNKDSRRKKPRMPLEPTHIMYTHNNTHSSFLWLGFARSLQSSQAAQRSLSCFVVSPWSSKHSVC